MRSPRMNTSSCSPAGSARPCSAWPWCSPGRPICPRLAAPSPWIWPISRVPRPDTSSLACGRSSTAGLSRITRRQATGSCTATASISCSATRSSTGRRPRAERVKPSGRPADMCVHELVEAIASAHPGHVAVECGDQVLTYRDLSERTSKLTRHLAGFGFRHPSVGILLPRSAEFVTAALAALKLGGSYTPLDAEYPLPRLKAMLAAARCPIVITATPLLSSLPAECDLVAVCLDTLDETLAALPADGPSIPVHPDLLAYTMFTSGSTRVPKG